MTHSITVSIVGISLWLCVVSAQAQTVPPKNPSEIAFSCPDHAVDTDHEVGFFLAGAAQPVQMQRVGDPLVESDGLVHATINSRPTGLTLGLYEMKVRIYQGTLVSDWGAGGAAGDQAVPFEAALRRPVNLGIVR